jgi:vacuolar-type H+-ATPase subunit E/Vma4
MNEPQAAKILSSMIAFIEQHGAEEVQAIIESSNNEFTIQKNAYVAEEKIKITENYKNELANQEVRLKIEKSKQQNAARIERMRKVNEIVETLKNELKIKVRNDMKND